MGQKVNPHGLRVGVIKDWNSRWYADTKDGEFANGRFIRNIFESMLMNHARRVVKIESPSINDLKELTENDIPLSLK